MWLLPVERSSLRISTIRHHGLEPLPTEAGTRHRVGIDLCCRLLRDPCDDGGSSKFMQLLTSALLVDMTGRSEAKDVDVDANDKKKLQTLPVQ